MMGVIYELSQFNWNFHNTKSSCSKFIQDCKLRLWNCLILMKIVLNATLTSSWTIYGHQVHFKFQLCKPLGHSFLLVVFQCCPAQLRLPTNRLVQFSPSVLEKTVDWIGVPRKYLLSSLQSARCSWKIWIPSTGETWWHLRTQISTRPASPLENASRELDSMAYDAAAEDKQGHWRPSTVAVNINCHSLWLNSRRLCCDRVPEVTTNCGWILVSLDSTIFSNLQELVNPA